MCDAVAGVGVVLHDFEPAMPIARFPLLVNVAGKGLIVTTGRGHAGVVNICRYAQRLTGLPLHAVLGGFHLNGPVSEPLIPRVLDDLAAMNPPS